MRRIMESSRHSLIASPPTLDTPDTSLENLVSRWSHSRLLLRGIAGDALMMSRLPRQQLISRSSVGLAKSTSRGHGFAAGYEAPAVPHRKQLDYISGLCPWLV